MTEHDGEVAKSMVVTGVDPKRWFIMVLAALAAFCQGAMVNFYSPISSPCKQVFGWDDDSFSWLLNASNITFVLCCPLWPMLIERKGLRPATILAYAFLVVSAMIRCLPTSTDGHYWVAIVSMVFNGAEFTTGLQQTASYVGSDFISSTGLAAPFGSLVPPAVSAVWFPVHERATATSVIVVAV